jgi:hypothetical protein
MDDWITKVYASSGRMTRMRPLVRHRVDVHGTRYAVDYAHERALAEQLRMGEGRLQRWLSQPASAT